MICMEGATAMMHQVKKRGIPATMVTCLLPNLKYFLYQTEIFSLTEIFSVPGREVAAHQAGGQCGHQVEGGQPGGLAEADPQSGVSLHLQLRYEAGGEAHQTSRVEGTQGGGQRAQDLNTD